jgi:hypothetical protein
MNFPRRFGGPAACVLFAALLALPPWCSTAAQQTAGSADGATPVTVSGTVYDSLAAHPLAGAFVQLAPSDLGGRLWSGRTDSLGSFSIADVPSGDYLVGFTHPELDSLGLEIPPMNLPGAGSDSIRLALAIPSARSVRAQLCPATRAADSSGVMLGFLHDAGTDARIEDGIVSVEWVKLVVDQTGEGAHAQQLSMTAKSTSAGWYALCGVPTGVRVTARAKLGDDASGYVSIQMPPRGMLLRDFSIARGSADTVVASAEAGSKGEQLVHRGNATLAGVVRDEQGKPLGGARLGVWGTGLSATSLDDGTFTISRLPAGTRTVETRHIGYAPERVTVDLVNERTQSVTVTMTQRADVLSDVTVYGQDRMLANVLSGFDQRRALGFGHFMTRADIVRKQPLRFTDLLNGVPGFRVFSVGGNEVSIVSSRSRGNSCKASIYLNGTHLKDPSDIDGLVDPNEVAGIELYSGISDTPPQFGRSQCGSIVIWTFPNLDSIDAEP